MKTTLNTLCLFLWLLPALSSAATKGTGLKGVRGSRALQPQGPPPPSSTKKCKKFKKADPKAVLARDGEGPDGAAKKGPGPDPKGADLKAAGPKAADLKAAGPKAADPKAADPKVAKATPPAPKAESRSEPPPPSAPKGEDECLEWEMEDRQGSGSTGTIEVDDPSMGSAGSSSLSDIKVDCDAIASDKGPKSSDSLSFEVNLDILKQSSASLKSVFKAIESELQTEVAPKLAGCSSSLSSSSTKIVHVDFGSLDFDQQGCDSSLAKSAASKGGVCVTGDVPVDVYFVGSVPSNMKSKVQKAVAAHDFSGLDGVMAVSEDVEVVQTASSLTGKTSGSGSSSGKQSGGVPAGAIGGVVAALVVAAAAFFLCCRKKESDSAAKPEQDTDEESDDDKVPVAQAVAVDGK